MNKNNFFMILFGMLIGTNVPMYSCEVVYGVMGAIATVTVIRTVQNNGTYQTYCQHKEKLALEKDISNNPLLYAQELPKQNPENFTEEKIKAFEKNYKQQQEVYNERLKPVVTKRRSIKIIDNYRDEK
jgi:hypothetical protein